MLATGEPSEGIPAVTWRIKDGADPGYTLFDLADRLRVRGWQVPAYTLPDNVSDIAVQRILVRQGVTTDLDRFCWPTFAGRSSTSISIRSTCR
jgi:glutamate decarboxylase